MPEVDGVSGEENNLIDPRWADLEKFQNLAFLNDAATEPTASDTEEPDVPSGDESATASGEKKEG